ncbi:serine hydrolase domain-containing protein [Anaeromyxobacter oryzae]|uniref:Esterase n=1 Tax=Anaeromyxobacter oryzae TaxID=2918170 RepID=A0ABM7WZ85_9BACT|nr:serine hydrolase domain-containing protein [Anaeromyxobacter oryzae]BDG04860.1 esterase [Anaeromyxobacter oryzae]
MSDVLPAVVAVLEAARKDGVAPALASAVLREGRVAHASWHGVAAAAGAGGPGSERPLRRDDLLDVASLTKVMATTTLAAQLVAAGALDLDAPVAARLPGFEAGGKERVTARHLLAHAAGLPAWRPYHARLAADPEAARLLAPARERPPAEALAGACRRGRALVREAVLAEAVEAPPGTRALYCDPGFIALGLLVERVAGAPLAALAAARIFSPLGLASTFFLDGTEPADARRRGEDRTFVPTGWSQARREVVAGAVNDDNAWAMGGVGGHAGVFSTALEVAALGQAWLDALSGGRSVVPASAAAEFARRDPAVAGSERALGWDTPSGGATSLGSRLGRGPRGAIGHLGYTGCSLWIDLDAGVVCALLTNHTHPGGTADKGRIRGLRQRFHDAVAESLGL